MAKVVYNGNLKHSGLTKANKNKIIEEYSDELHILFFLHDDDFRLIWRGKPVIKMVN